jgi:uncharacterized membrane protein
MSRLAPWLTLILAVAGILVAAYLTYVHYEQDALVCGLGDCSLVQGSSYAKLLGIPIAILGLAMYIAILGLGVLRFRLPQRAELCTGLLFTLSLAGLIYALYLTYVEVWVIEAICQWCVISAVITAAIFAIEAKSLWSPDDPEVA